MIGCIWLPKKFGVNSVVGLLYTCKYTSVSLCRIINKCTSNIYLCIYVSNHAQHILIISYVILNSFHFQCKQVSTHLPGKIHVEINKLNNSTNYFPIQQNVKSKSVKINENSTDFIFPFNRICNLNQSN
jgi:hypothetical protein